MWGLDNLKTDANNIGNTDMVLEKTAMNYMNREEIEWTKHKQ